MALDLLKFYETNKFKFDGKLAYGVYRNRIINILPSGNYVKVTIPFSKQLLKEQGQKVSERLSKIKANNKALQRGLTTNVYMELMIYQSADVNQELLTVLNLALDVLDELDITTCEICPICGNILHTNDPFIRVRDSVIQGHDQCVEQFFNTSRQIDKNFEQNTKKGMTKTILIAILCFLFFVLLITSMSFVNAYSYLIMFAGLGYMILSRYLHNKMKVFIGKKQIIILLIFAMLTIISSTYLGSSAILYKSGEFSMTYGEVLINYFKIISSNFETIGKAIIGDILLNTICIALFALSYFKIIDSRTPKVYKLK